MCDLRSNSGTLGFEFSLILLRNRGLNVFRSSDRECLTQSWHDDVL